MAIFRSYTVTLSSDVWYVLAKDSEAAAWAALDLSKDKGSKLINVRLTEEW